MANHTHTWRQSILSLLISTSVLYFLQWNPNTLCGITNASSYHSSQRRSPEGVSDAVAEVQEVPVVAEEQVSRVEVDVSRPDHVPQDLALRLGLVPRVAQELTGDRQGGHQHACLPCTKENQENPVFVGAVWVLNTMLQFWFKRARVTVIKAVLFKFPQ